MQECFAPLPEDSRLTTFPIARPEIWKWYQNALACFWTPNEMSFTKDAEQYANDLTADERHFVKFVLAFFAASDGIVNMNLAERFRTDIKILEVTYFFDFQIAMENVHAQTYSMLLDAIIPSASERDHLFNAIKTMPVIEKMAKYMFDTINSAASLARRLFRMACVEGIFFTGCFCVIYWLQSRSLMPAMAHSNELIARDEGLHTMFALFLYHIMEEEFRLSEEEIHCAVDEAVAIAKNFIAAALPNGMSGMNAELMGRYIENRADDILDIIGYKTKYNSPKAEFTFNDQLSLPNRSDFFIRRVSEYKQGIYGAGDGGQFHEDF